MQRKTQTTLGQLRIGDRFVYNPKRVDVWQVMARADKKGKVAVNQITSWGAQVHKFDELISKNKKVVFLRHSIPVQGEEVFLEDLKPGDVFHMKDNVIHEYELMNKDGVDFYDCRRLDQAAPIKGGRLSTVIFVRHKD